MNSHKYVITNRNGLKLVIQVDEPDVCKGLVLIEHGQRGSKTDQHIQAFADAFLNNSYRVVRFDATHSQGESEGKLEDITYDTHISDLEDVIMWAKHQPWLEAQLALCGHSMGAQAAAWYAEHHPSEISLLLPMAPTINYDLWEKAENSEATQDWKKQGYIENRSRSTGKIVRVGWQVNESLKKFDILPFASRLTMPVLNIVGDHDVPCPVTNQEVFMQKIASSDKQLVVLPGLEHSYRDFDTNEYSEKLHQVTDTIDNWLKAHEQ